MTDPALAEIGMASPRIQIISLGAGVQSTTMALMAAHGLITPMPMCAIFADTQSEPAAVYDHLDWLRSPGVLPFPVHIVTAGNLGKTVVSGDKANGKYLYTGIPVFVKSDNGSVGIINRSCTRDYKITPQQRKVRQLLGIFGKRSPREPVVAQWIGISIDEASRMKPGREVWQAMRWPLIEKRMTRRHCLEWLEKNGYRIPVKSACVFCPFHDNATWRRMRGTPEWEAAIAVDRRLRDRPAKAYRANGRLYLHRSCKPLEEVDLDTLEDLGQLNMFENECEGMCGV